MTCLNKNKQGTEILLDYCAGTLDAERAGAVEQHALECGECRALIAAQKHLWNALDELEAPEIPADFDARLYARIARENAGPAWKNWLRELSSGGFAPDGLFWQPLFSWKPVIVGAAAVTVLAVGLSLHLVTPHAPNAQNAPAQIRPESVDAEQVEVTLEDLEMLMPPAASAGRM
jgi:anti-sigma-K factor RskA